VRLTACTRTARLVDDKQDNFWTYLRESKGGVFHVEFEPVEGDSYSLTVHDILMCIRGKVVMDRKYEQP
jgi:hypothetical protein